MHQDDREEWLADLGERMGLGKLAFNAGGVCQLVLDKELLVTLYRAEDSSKLVVFGQLQTPPLEPGALRQMLKRNRSSARSSAPVISLSPDEDAVEAYLVLDPEELRQAGDAALERVIEELEYWRQARTTDFAEPASEPVNHNISFV